jgi:aminoglycoside phosphotransferase (APT) family kinase protein
LVERVEQLLGRTIDSMRLLGPGVDHAVFDIGGDLVARVPIAPAGDAGALVREARLLEVVAGVSPIPVPTMVAYDAATGVAVATKLPGVSLLDEPCPAPERLADPLAGFLAVLRSIPDATLDGLVDTEADPPAAYFAEAGEIFSRVAHVRDPPQRRLVERFVAADPPPPVPERVLSHNDLGAEHLLATPDRLTLTGVIDWADAARADPAVDLGRLHRDFGPRVASRIARRLTDDPDTLVARAAFYARCALLEDLAFGLATGDHRYSETALANLSRTFADHGDS